MRFIHGLGIVVGSEVKIGECVTVYQGVTLGGNNGKKKMIDNCITGQPVIGNNVTLYTDAKVFGPIELPDNSIVKAGSVISCDSQVQNKTGIGTQEKKG